MITSGPSPRTWSSSAGDGTGALCRLTAATLERMRIRPATADDAEAIAAIVLETDLEFAKYAPPHVQLTTYDEEVEHARKVLSVPTRWIAVPDVEGEVAGYVAFASAAH